jgi:hypothetical protein
MLLLFEILLSQRVSCACIVQHFEINRVYCIVAPPIYVTREPESAIMENVILNQHGSMVLLHFLPPNCAITALIGYFVSCRHAH